MRRKYSFCIIFVEKLMFFSIFDFFFCFTDLGPCFGMNGHPRRATGVILRLSKSTIKDLSFYIGFTRIGSRIKDLGHCSGMNGHFRRDPDVILRLSESTIDFLSFYIGFGS